METELTDAQKVLQSMVSACGDNIVTAVTAWAMAVVDIIAQLGLPDARLTMAAPVLEHWGILMPYAVRGSKEKFPFYGTEEKVLKGYYLHTQQLALLVGRILPSVPDRQDAVVDGLVIREVTGFCKEALAEIESYSGLGLLGCTGEGFQTHTFHLRQLLLVAIGPEHEAEFLKQFDASMESLAEYYRLLQAPKQ